MKRVLLSLQPENLDKNSPSKKLNKDGSITSYHAGLLFYFTKNVYDEQNEDEKGFHEAIKLLLNDKTSFLILGELTDFGEAMLEVGKASVRRKVDKGDGLGASVEVDHSSNIMILDLDDHYYKGWNPLDPEPTIKAWLEEKKIDCDVTYQITSSQKLDSELMRIRLYFICSKNYSLDYRKAYATSDEIGADGSVFSSMQPIYTSPPNFEDDSSDFIPVRSGHIKGSRRTFTLPDLTPKEVKLRLAMSGIYTPDQLSGELPEEVISGQVYRRFFMPYAFSLANKGLNRDDIAALIEMKTAATPREFDRDNVYAYIDDAYARIEEEGKSKTYEEDEEIVRIEDLDYFKTEKIPGDEFTRHEWASGFLGEFAKEIFYRMAWPNKEIAILAARCVTASLIGRKFSFNDLNLSQNNVMLGAQAIGKETINWALNMVLSQLCELKPLAGKQIRAFSSGQAPKGITALHRNMASSPSTMVLISEAGKDSKSLTGDKAGVQAYTLTNFAVGAHAIYVVNDLTNPLPKVYGTNFVRVEESEINSYAHNFTSDNATSGEMARKNHHFISPVPDEMPDITLMKSKFSEKIIKGFWDIYSIASVGEDFSTVKKFGKTSWQGPCLVPLKSEHKIELGMDYETHEIINSDLKEEYKIRKHSKLDTEDLEWTRMARHREKVMREAAFLCAVNMIIDGSDPKVSLKNYNDAEAYINECERSDRKNHHLFNSIEDKLMNEILRTCLKLELTRSYEKAHTQEQIKNRMIKHSFLFAGSRRVKKLADKLSSQDKRPGSSGSKIINESYVNGENMKYWEILDGTKYDSAERFSLLGVKKDRGKYIILKVESLENIEENDKNFYGEI